jgi:hypothetical protein
MDNPGEQLPALHLGFLTGTFPSNITNINATESSMVDLDTHATFSKQY